MSQAPPGWQRNRPGLGLWEHRGKVAVAGLGHSSLDRRWDGVELDRTLGALTVAAAQGAIVDAGIHPVEIDSVVSCPGPTGDRWSPRPYLAPPYDSEDGLTLVTAEWLSRQAGLTQVQQTTNMQALIGHALSFACQAVGDGRFQNCLVVYPMGNIPGRYHQSAEMADDRAPGEMQWMMPWGYYTSAGVRLTLVFREYCRKYNRSEDGLGPLVAQLRKNGLLVPWGYYTTHEPKEVTREDYLVSRYIQKPLRMLDCDRPVNGAGAYLITSSERASHMRQAPVYVLNHTQFRAKSRGQMPGLAEMEVWSKVQADMMLEGCGLRPQEVDVFNAYDGFSTLPQFFLEAFEWHEVKKGEAFDFYDGDLTVGGPDPFLSSGGNLGCGRTRTAHFHDSVEQLRGTAGPRQIQIRCETAFAECGAPDASAALMLSKVAD